MDLSALEPYLPTAAVVPLLERWLEAHDFQLVLSRPRQTKLGDFRPPRPGQQAKITMNLNLGPYQFLTTLTHEIAHLKTWDRYGRKAAPHGAEWKAMYGAMLVELAGWMAWPPDYHGALLAHARRPKAAVGGDPGLQQVLLRLDGAPGGLLGELAPGDTFTFKGRTFQYLEKRRTRALVEETASRKRYTISLVAPVERTE